MKSREAEEQERFSSRTEFDAKKHVQITNELPPMDMYDMAHSLVKNSLWKWFLGYSTVVNDVEEPAKYVNGVKSKEFGPGPQLVWNPSYESDYAEYLKIEPNGELTKDDFKYVEEIEPGRQIEIDGALLPEVDFLLHEGYRYLSVLYPDHPDFMRLLTTNEFEDDIAQSAALIDYSPDQTFFNWLARTFPVDDEGLEIEEAAKLKIRNLLDHAYRRKFFGAKEGYRAFASDVFQHVNVYPTAKYVTEKTSVLNGRPFRLLDWDGSTYDFNTRWVPPAKLYGTAWPTPYSRFILYEYPLQKVIDEADVAVLKDGLSTSRTIKTDFRAGQKINIGEAEGHITAIREESTYTAIVNTNTKVMEAHENPNSLTAVDVDFPVEPFYSNFTVVPSLKKLTNIIADYEKSIYYCDDQEHKSKNKKTIANYNDRKAKSVFSVAAAEWKKYSESKSMKDALSTITDAFYHKKALKLLDKAKVQYPEAGRIAKVTPDPHQDGCLHLTPVQFLTVYEEKLNVSLEKVKDEETGEEIPTVTYGATAASPDGYVAPGDFLVSEGGFYAAEVLGLSSAKISFDIEDGTARSPEECVAPDNPIGLVFRLSDNNPEGGGKKVVVYGTPVFGPAIKTDVRYHHYACCSVTISPILAIPTVKSHEALRGIYGGDFKAAAQRKWEALHVLLSSGGKGPYYDIRKALDEFVDTFTSLKDAVREIVEAAEAKNLLFRDSHWKKLNKLSEKYIKLFKEKRPELHKQLDQIYANWHTINDVSFEKLPPVPVLEKALNEILGEFTKYYEEYYYWESEEAVIIETPALPASAPSGSDVVKKSALEALKRADEILFNVMLPNRSLLLTEGGAYSLLNGQDEYVCALEYGINVPFNDQLTQEQVTKYGTHGLLTADEWSFGTLNTATVVETHWNPDTNEYVTEDVVDQPNKPDFIDEFYYHPAESKWIQQYESEKFPDVMTLLLDEENPPSNEVLGSLSQHEQEKHVYTKEDSIGIKYFEKEAAWLTLPYWNIDEAVQEIYDSVDSTIKFAYGDPNFMEDFLEPLFNDCDEGQN